jgi:Profilin.
MQLSVEEQKAIVGAFANEQSLEKVQASGLRLAGNKFFTLQANDRSIYCKKGVSNVLPSCLMCSCASMVFTLSSLQADGVVVVKTKQAVLVAEYTPPIQAPEATPVVEGLADYLISVGY